MPIDVTMLIVFFVALVLVALAVIVGPVGVCRGVLTERRRVGNE